MSNLQKLNFEKDVIGFFISGHPLDDFKIHLDTLTTCGASNIDEFKNREVRLAGIISRIKTGNTKKGTRFATFVLEDMSGSVEIALFNEDFAKFSGYVAESSMIFLSALYQPGWRDPSVFELKVKDVKFLAEAVDKMSRKLLIRLELSKITEGYVDQLLGLLSNHAGNTEICLRVYDRESQVVLDFDSRKVRVNPTMALIRELETFGLDFQLK